MSVFETDQIDTMGVVNGNLELLIIDTCNWEFEEEHFERAYEESEIEEVLKQVGFTLLGKFDGYNRDEVQQESERILYVVGKNMEV